ncbi:MULTISPECIES: DNA repair protein RadC [unclassified Eikenella]|uniref:RadC family protein n=1 Tax=unclassified Eikenella TaxID=2639367 RepID=UPI0007E16F02|nr:MULTISPECIES: DNA repair protein RadC [unclassified Eikenella]OAM28691.1 hypothetical protein A7P94_01315 [Eikenella sp. NML01-A-086]OAM41443.1 hypothetical protein A7Q02_07655 [Eikenella sp. NML97-A-109]
MGIKHWPENERPREKLLHRGAGALSDAELLAILLRVGIQGMSAVDLARYLLQEFGSLNRLFSAPVAELTMHKGMGEAAYCQFAVVREIGRRLLAEEMRATPAFTSPEAVADYLVLQLAHEPVEVSVALLLSSSNRLIAFKELSRGTVAENTVYIREVAQLALQHHAASLIIAHNHPGGSAEPSAADLAFTRQLQQALALLEVRLLDHFIVAGNRAVSFAANGWLPELAGGLPELGILF